MQTNPFLSGYELMVFIPYIFSKVHVHSISKSRCNDIIIATEMKMMGWEAAGDRRRGHTFRSTVETYFFDTIILL
jgi:hypothetical protein